MRLEVIMCYGRWWCTKGGHSARMGYGGFGSLSDEGWEDCIALGKAIRSRSGIFANCMIPTPCMSTHGTIKAGRKVL